MLSWSLIFKGPEGTALQTSSAKVALYCCTPGSVLLDFGFSRGEAFGSLVRHPACLLWMPTLIQSGSASKNSFDPLKHLKRNDILFKENLVLVYYKWCKTNQNADKVSWIQF